MVDVGNVPAVMTGNNDGFGGSGIWAILLLALLGNRWGNGCGEGNGRCFDDAIDNAELNGRFNSIERQIDNINDLEQLRDNFQEICDTKMMVAENRAVLGSQILDSKCDLSAQIAENKFDNAIIAKDAELAAQRCCCETNRHIDQVQYEAATNKCEIINAVHAEGELTRGLINADKIESLRDKLAAEQLKTSQIEQNAALINALRPFPQPAWGVNNPYQSNNCNCGCGVGGYGYF